MRLPLTRGRFVMILSAVSALLLLAGCSSPTNYRPIVQGHARDGGYSHTRHSADTYSVTYQGTEYSKTEQIYDFALLRSAELTEACGFKFFTVQAASDRSRELARYNPPYRATETRTTTVNGVTRSYEATTSHGPAHFTKIKIPIHTLTVQMFASREGIRTQAGDVHEAAPLVAQLKSKYHTR